MKKKHWFLLVSAIGVRYCIYSCVSYMLLKLCSSVGFSYVMLQKLYSSCGFSYVSCKKIFKNNCLLIVVLRGQISACIYCGSLTSDQKSIGVYTKKIAVANLRVL